MARRPHILDTVKLTREWEGWPAGTVGAVVSERLESVLVEVVSETTSDADGLPTTGLLDDLISVPYTALQVVDLLPSLAPSGSRGR